MEIISMFKGTKKLQSIYLIMNDIIIFILWESIQLIKPDMFQLTIAAPYNLFIQFSIKKWNFGLRNKCVILFTEHANNHFLS